MPDSQHFQSEDLFERRTAHDLLVQCRVFTSKPPTTKREMGEFLTAQLQPPLLAATLARIPPDGLRALAHAAHGNGLRRSALKVAPGLKPGSMSPDRSLYWLPRSEPKPANTPFPLFFPDDMQMPAVLRARVAALLPAPPVPPLTPLVGEPPGTIVAGDVLGDFAVILHLAATTGIALGRTDTPSAASLRQLCTSLTAVSGDRAGDQFRVIRAVWLLVMGKVAERGPDGVKAKPGATVGHPELRRMFAAFCAGVSDELSEITAIRGRHDAYAPWSDPRERRAELLRVIARCPSGHWIPVRNFLDHSPAVAAVDPLYEVAPTISLGRDYESRLDALGEPGLDLLRDTWIRLVIFAYLAPLGAVEIAVGEPEPRPVEQTKSLREADDFPAAITPADTLLAFRVTPLGAWLLGTGPEPEQTAPAPTGGWKLQADGTIIALGQGIAPAERLLLDRIGQRLDERSWRLGRDPLLKALAAGETAAGLRTQLNTMSGGPLPETMARLLDDVQRRATAVTIDGTVILLRVIDRHAVEQFVHDRTTAPLCRDLGNGILAVAPKSYSAFRRAVRKLGWNIPDHDPG